MTMWVQILGLAWVLIAIILLLPFVIVICYTINSVFPVLAAVGDLDETIYEPLESGQTADRDIEGNLPKHRKDDDPDTLELDQTAHQDNNENSPQLSKRSTQTRPDMFSFRSMARLLYSPRKWFSLTRGLSWYFLWAIGMLLTPVATAKLPFVLGFLAQVVLPLPLIPLHALWVHTILTSPSSQPFWRRLAPIQKIFKAAVLPMFILLIAQAITQSFTSYIAGNTADSFEYWTLLQSNPGKYALLCALVPIQTLILTAPAHFLLVRVETSLISADERTIIPLDPALSTDQYERGYMTLIEAWKSTTRALLVNQAFVYFRIFAITFAAIVIFASLNGALFALLVLLPSKQ